MVLNHYTDLKDLGPGALSGPVDEDCSAVVAKTPEGAVLGQTWDMHGSAAPFVLMLHVPAHEDRPEAWLLSITGCLGMAGLNASGVGVTINNLKSHDARVGVVWPALVRRMLAERSAEAAERVLVGAPMSSGHHYLVADAERAYGVETSGVLKHVAFEAEWAKGPASYVHTNHCVSDEVGAVSWVSDTSTTRERYDWLTTEHREPAALGRDGSLRAARLPRRLPAQRVHAPRQRVGAARDADLRRAGDGSRREAALGRAGVHPRRRAGRLRVLRMRDAGRHV